MSSLSLVMRIGLWDRWPARDQYLIGYMQVFAVTPTGAYFLDSTWASFSPQKAS